MYKVAIIQESPVFLDKNQTIKKVISLVEKAAKSLNLIFINFHLRTVGHCISYKIIFFFTI
jgi:hypothetical protein